MVDFNNDSTIGTPAIDVEKISILQRRYDLIEAYEDYKKKSFNNQGVPISIIRARLISLFLELQAILKRRLDTNSYNSLKEIVFKNNTKEDEILNSIIIINEQLDEIRLTRIDTQKVYDTNNVEEENENKGF